MIWYQSSCTSKMVNILLRWLTMEHVLWCTLCLVRLKPVLLAMSIVHQFYLFLFRSLFSWSSLWLGSSSTIFNASVMLTQRTDLRLDMFFAVIVVIVKLHSIMIMIHRVATDRMQFTTHAGLWCTVWIKKQSHVHFTVVSTRVDRFLQYLAQSIVR